MLKIVAPLPGWNVRGYSYGEVTPQGERHPGADLNVGGGDEDLGLPVLCFADGQVAARREWDGREHGYGNAVLVEHRLFVPAGDPDGGVRLWSLYAHLDGFDVGCVPGAWMSAGERIGACGKSGGQTWAHLHFELRYMGPPRMPLEFWGGRINYEAQSARYADPYTVLRVLEGVDVGDVSGAARVRERMRGVEEELAVVRADREWNYGLKMRFEGVLREMEGKRRLKRGTVEKLIAGV